MTTEGIQALVDETEVVMRLVVAEAESAASSSFGSRDLPVYDVVRYHLGWVDESFNPACADQGKRVRPTICFLAAGAAGGSPGQAVPIAAAIELLHNFTLMHDDIQDRSELRRGRPTVWRNWGESQAINAGDATFALSQLAALKLQDANIDPSVTVELLAEFNRMTLRIVEGQVLDLGFEDRWDIRPEDYLRMIDGKTAAIVAFAAWAGARVAGVDEQTCQRYKEFGRVLGLGFQLRDDYLGIWGDSSATGKERGDDIRGRKKSIPVVLLLSSMSEAQMKEFRSIYASDEPAPEDVDRVIRMLDEYMIDERVQEYTNRYHADAIELLSQVSPRSHYRDALQRLAERLVERAK